MLFRNLISNHPLTRDIARGRFTQLSDGKEALACKVSELKTGWHLQCGFGLSVEVRSLRRVGGRRTRVTTWDGEKESVITVPLDHLFGFIVPRDWTDSAPLDVALGQTPGHPGGTRLSQSLVKGGTGPVS